MSLFTKLGNDIASPVDAAGNKRSVENIDFQRWMTEVERLFSAFQAGGGVIFPDLTTANASLDYGPNQMAWVMGGDAPGIYRKVGASGTGSWSRMGDLPLQVIPLTNVGAGSADAIIATPSLPLPTTPGAALFTINIIADNTGPVTINGKPWRTNVGNEFVAGGIKAGGIYLFLDNGDHYRSITDQDVSALVAQAEAEANRAQGFAAMLSADKVKFKTVPLLIADDTMSYADEPGKIQVGSGDMTEAGGFRYEVKAVPSMDYHVANANGVLLKYLPNGSVSPAAIGIVDAGNEASKFYMLCSIAKATGLPIHLSGAEFSVNSDENEAHIHFDQNNVAIYGPGKIKGDIFKVRGNGWLIRDHVEFEFAGEDDVASRYATSGALGGMFLSGSDNLVDKSCKIYRVVAPDETFWTGRGTALVMGMDYEIGDTGNAISATNGPPPTGHGNWVDGCEIFNSSTGVRSSGKRNGLLNSYVHDCAVVTRWEPTSRNCIIWNNRIFGMGADGPGGGETGTNGILCSRNCSGMLIAKNEVAFAGEHGLYFQGDRSVIRDNYFHDNARSAYKLAAYDSGVYWYDDETPILLHPLGHYMGFDVVVEDNISENDVQAVGAETNASFYLQVGGPDPTGLVNYQVKGNVSRNSGGRGIFVAYANTSTGLFNGGLFEDNFVFGASGEAATIKGDKDIVIKGLTTDGLINFYNDKSAELVGFIDASGVKADVINISSGSGLLKDSSARDIVWGGGVDNAGWDLDNVTFGDAGNLNIKKVRQMRHCKGTMLSMRAPTTSGFIESLIGNDITFTADSGYAMDAAASHLSFGNNPNFSGNTWRAPNANSILRLGSAQTGANISGDTFIPATGAITTDPCIQVSGDGNVLTGVIVTRGTIWLPSGGDNNVVIGCRTGGAITNSGSGNQLAANVVF